MQFPSENNKAATLILLVYIFQRFFRFDFFIPSTPFQTGLRSYYFCLFHLFTFFLDNAHFGLQWQQRKKLTKHTRQTPFFLPPRHRTRKDVCFSPLTMEPKGCVGYCVVCATKLPLPFQKRATKDAKYSIFYFES